MASLGAQPFLEAADLELKRAERYRIFVSMVLLDLNVADHLQDKGDQEIHQELLQLVGSSLRAFDSVALMPGNRMALLMPETPRQGAEAAARRATELIRNRLAEISEVLRDVVVPLEMTSYPDAAGARSVAEILEDLAEAHVN